MRSLTDRQALKNCHEIGIRLKLLEIDSDIEKPGVIKIDNINNNQELR